MIFSFYLGTEREMVEILQHWSYIKKKFCYVDRNFQIILVVEYVILIANSADCDEMPVQVHRLGRM